MLLSPKIFRKYDVKQSSESPSLADLRYRTILVTAEKEKSLIFGLSLEGATGTDQETGRRTKGVQDAHGLRSLRRHHSNCEGTREKVRLSKKN